MEGHIERAHLDGRPLNGFDYGGKAMREMSAPRWDAKNC
jgi:hypothetical protein